MEEEEDYVHPFPPSLTPAEEEEEANAYTSASPSDVRPIGVAPVFLFLPPPFFPQLVPSRDAGHIRRSVRYSDAVFDAIAASAD